MQKRFYARQGVNAWNAGLVPSYFSANAFVAWAYAQVIDGFIRDCRGDASGPPVTIVELGAGAGRLAYLVIKNLLALTPDGAPARFRYLMTDFARRNIEAWQACAAFQPFRDLGLLEFSMFDADRPAEFEPLGPGGAQAMPGPTVVIANYVVDTLRQDAFRIMDGRLVESLTAAASRTKRDPEDPDILKHVKLERELRPVELPYYEDTALDSILAEYRRILDDTAFLIPVGFIGCLKAFEDMSNGPMMALIGDKGRRSDADLKGRRDQGLVLHDGCFSFSANFNALDRYTTHRGGAALFSEDLDRRFIVAALLTGAAADGFAETRRAFHRAIQRFGPRDIMNLLERTVALDEPLPLDALLLLLKLGNFDTRTLHKFRKQIIAAIDGATEPQRRELSRALERVWETYFPIGTTRDIPYAIGRIHEALGEPAKAVGFYRHSLEERGERARTLYGLARCHQEMGDAAAALSFAEHSLRLDPDLAGARRLARRLAPAAQPGR